MTKLLALLALLFVAFAPHGAEARLQHPQTFTFCDMGLLQQDGCLQAPQLGLTPGMQGEILHPDCFVPGGYINQVTGTTTDYTNVRPPFNVPGCDFPVGKWTPDSQLLDPASGIPGCTFTLGAGTGGNPVLDCGSLTGFVGFNGYNLGPVGGSSPHGCTSVVLEGNITTPIDIHNNKFLGDGNCAFQGVFRHYIFQRLANPNPQNYYSNTLDMNGGNFSDIFGSCPSTTAGGLVCNLDSAIDFGGQVSMKDNAFLNSPFAPLLNNNATGGSLVFRSNFLNRWNIRFPAAHAEAYSPNGVGSQSLNDFSFNALIGSTGVQGSGSVPLPTGLTFFHTISQTKINHNVNVDPFVGGGPRGVTSASVCVGGLAPTGTTCDTTTPGGNIYVASVTAPTGVPPVVWSGLFFPSCDGLAFALSTSVSGTTSSGIGGGFTGGVGAVFGADLDVPAAYGATGSIATNAPVNFTVASIALGAMTLSSPATLPVGSLLTSGSISFAGATVTAATDTTHYTISNTGITGSGSATANSTVNFTVASISTGAMVLSAAATLPVGSLLTSGSIAFAGATVTAETDTTHYTISNTSITGSGSATANVTGALAVTTPGVLVPQIGYVLTAGGSSFTITGVASGGNANSGPWLVTPGATVASGALSITIGNTSAGGWVAYPGGCTINNPEPAAYASANGTFMGMFSANTSAEVIGNYTDESATAGGFQPWAGNMLCSAPTLFGATVGDPNVDMGGFLNSLTMNSWPAGQPSQIPTATGHGCAADAPVNTSPPVISGVAQDGNILTEGGDAWTNSPSNFLFQWWSSGGAQVAATASPGESITVTSISGTTMKVFGVVTLAPGASITSSVSGFPSGITVPGGGTGSTFTITNTAGGSFTGSAPAMASGAVTFTFVGQTFSGLAVPWAQGYITTSGYTGGASVYNFSTPQAIVSPNAEHVVILSSANDGTQTGGDIQFATSINGSTLSSFPDLTVTSVTHSISAASVSLTVTSISGTTMTTSASVTIPDGATITSGASGFPTGITVPTGGTGTSFTIVNPGSGSFSGSAAATAASANFTVASISSGAMTLSTPTTIALGSLLESSSISFAGAFVTAKTDTTHYTISNTSITGSGTATANAINFNFPGQTTAPTGNFTTSGFGGNATIYNFSTPQPITASSGGTATIASGATLTLPATGSTLGQIQLPMAPFVGDYIFVQEVAYNTTNQNNFPGQSQFISSQPAGPILAAAAPIVITPPTISGTPQVGQLLTVTPGVYSGRPTSFTEQWQVAGSNVGPANSLTYIPVSGDATKAVRVVETAANVTGTTTTNSTPTSNVASAGPVATCTGGTHTSDGSGNTVIKFTSSGTLSCTEPFAAQDLVVGGGGGATTGGGGAGGYCTTLGTPTCGQGGGIEIPASTLTITVGAGGAGNTAASTTAVGAQGLSSSLGSIVTAIGGGGGAPIHSTPAGSSGGSGGGAGSPISNATVAGGIGSQGFNGGSAFGFASPSPGAGGGGAGAMGGIDTNPGTPTAGVGGAGLSNSITGTSTPYAGGGAGGYFTSGGSIVSGGTGGGGNSNPSGVGGAGASNTGGGGGGADGGNIGGAGGSGIVIISCPTAFCGS